MMKRITIFGSTGSIGRNTLDVVARFPDKFSVQYLTANSNVELLIEQALQYRPKAVAISTVEHEKTLRERLAGEGIEVLAGEDALCEIARRSDSDFVVGALVGFAGLKPTIEALKAGKKYRFG